MLIKQEKMTNYHHDKAELSQKIIIISSFAITALLIIGTITTVLLLKGENTIQCINNSISSLFTKEKSTNCFKKYDKDQEPRNFNWVLDNQYGNTKEYSLGLKSMGYSGISGNELFEHYTKIDHMVNQHLKNNPIQEPDPNSLEDIHRYNQEIENITNQYTKDYPDIQEFYNTTREAMKDCEQRLQGKPTRMVTVHERGEELNMSNYYVSCTVN